MFNFNIFSIIFKKRNKDVKNDIEQYQAIRLMKYVKIKYPNCPNSDYIKIMKGEQEKINQNKKSLI